MRTKYDETTLKNEFIHNSMLRTTTEIDTFHGSKPNKSIMQNRLFYNSLNYRGFNIEFFCTDENSQLFADINGDIVPLGFANATYIEDTKHIIDLKLDLIETFDDIIPATYLMFFSNGDSRDIKLVCKGRILKIFLVSDENKLNIPDIILQAHNIINKYIKIAEIE